MYFPKLTIFDSYLGFFQVDSLQEDEMQTELAGNSKSVKLKSFSFLCRARSVSKGRTTSTAL